MSSRRARQNIPLPVIDLGEALGMPRPPPGSNNHNSIREFFQQRQRRAQEQAETALTNAAEGTGHSNNNASRRQDASATQSSIKQASRKRLAADNGSHYEEVNRTRRPAKELDFIHAAFCGDSDSQQPHASIQNIKLAAVMPPASDGSHNNTVASKTSTSTTRGVLQDVARLSNAAKATTLSSSYGMNRCVSLLPTPSTCSKQTTFMSAAHTPIPFHMLVNFPQNMGHEGSVNKGTKNCAMCDQKCPFVTTKKNAPEGTERVILKGSSSVCNICNGSVWQVVDSKLEVRRCRECNKWYAWAEFQGTKGMVKKCSTCRTTARKRAQKMTSTGNGKPPATGLNRCVPLVPTPATFSRMTASEDSTASSSIAFPMLANFPQYVGHANDEGSRNCVMCGEECPWVRAKGDAPNDAPRLIMTNASGICTVCCDCVWQVVDSKLEVKRCQTCHKWYSWAHFHGERGMAQSCRPCLSQRKSRPKFRDKKAGNSGCGASRSRRSK